MIDGVRMWMIDGVRMWMTDGEQMWMIDGVRMWMIYGARMWMTDCVQMSMIDGVRMWMISKIECLVFELLFLNFAHQVAWDPNMNAIECNLGTSVRFPAKIAPLDITSMRVWDQICVCVL